MKVVQYRDGKTATVALLKSTNGGLTLLTNGKADAKINMGPGAPTPDEPTMILLGALPLAANPRAKTAANIGMGSGLTAHTLLSTPQLERLDIIEIEAEMINGARGYGERVRHVFEDPRSHINIEDAKVFFSTRKTKYDIIISEPSNPWVSGVASLFSRGVLQTRQQVHVRRRRVRAVGAALRDRLEAGGLDHGRRCRRSSPTTP